MRSATLAALMAALATGVAAAAGVAAFSPSAAISTCGPASDPHVVFPYRTPQSASEPGVSRCSAGSVNETSARGGPKVTWFPECSR